MQPIRVEVAPGQVETCQVYEMEELLSVASTRIATMYHNNPVSLDVPGGSAAYCACLCVRSVCLCVSSAVFLTLYKIGRVPVLLFH